MRNKNENKIINKYIGYNMQKKMLNEQIKEI